jgi:hypothetical protein
MDGDDQDVNYQDVLEQAKEVQSYIDPTTYPSDLDGILESKEQAMEILTNLLEKILKEIMANEEVVETIRSEKPDAEKQEFNPSSFQISKST